MSQQSILNCALPVWYPNFKDCTVLTTFFKAPESFIDYLLSDEGLFLPERQPPDETSDLNAPPDQSTATDLNNGAKTRRLLQCDEFRQFQRKVDDAIRDLGGKVFPKLNWSAPRDASWIALNNSLCCENFVDVCLLMKSSDFITHDLTTPFQSQPNPDTNTNTRDRVEYSLALRQWVDLAPSGEYRCFVRDGELIAISQRHLQYFEFIVASKESIVKKIKRFFRGRISKRFPETSYTFDVYLGGCSNSHALIDFNPFTEVTDSLLFTWDELIGEEPIADEAIADIFFRFVPPEGITSANDMKMYSLPVDIQHLTTGQDPAKLLDLLQLHTDRGQSDSSNDDDDDDT